jgi:ComF family protein
MINPTKRTFGIWHETLKGLTDLAWPNLCLLCGTPLIEGEKGICLNCMFGLPSIKETSFKDNATTERLLGKIGFEQATSGFRYTKEANIQKAIELFKYKGEKEIGLYLGKMAGDRLNKLHFFDPIDYIIPVPLHASKLKKRGYNQCDWIAKGLSVSSGKKIIRNVLKRSFSNETQTTRNIWNRWENSKQLFELDYIHNMEGKHVLLIDDVLTSGSTMETCGRILLQIPGVQVSFFALALA